MPLDWLAKFLTGENQLHLNFLNFKNRSHKEVDKRKSTDKSKHLDKSKHVIKDSPTTTSDNHSSSVTYNGPVLQLNITTQGDGTLSPDSLAMLQPILDAFEQKQVSLLADEPRRVLSDVRAHEQDIHVRGLLNFFKSRISPVDFQLMRTGLYLKHLREQGMQDEAKRLWYQTTQGKSPRDRRVIELASTDYFSTLFRPLYKALLRANSDHAQKRFEKEYESILSEMRFAIFVHAGMKVEDIAEQVIKKAISNIKYGVKDDIICMHGTGTQQVMRVKAAVQKLRQTFPSITISTSPKGTEIIKASVEYRKNSLDPSLLEDADLSPVALS